MGYNGIEFTSQEDYLFSDTKPIDPEFDLEQLKNIQCKLEEYVSGKREKGITGGEAETFLNWITFNARNCAVRNVPESPISSSMYAQCAPTQAVNFKILKKIGLDVRAFNTGNTIGDIPMEEKEKRMLLEHYGGLGVRHSVSSVKIPISTYGKKTELYTFLLDPTFRQFCLKKNCNDSNFDDRKAPDPGYFMKADNLLKLGESQEVAKKSELLAKYIISRGYFLLSNENAKIYGDAFVRASKRKEFQNMPIDMTGEQYIENFENIPMPILDYKEYEKYEKLPSEMEVKKKGIFKRILDYFNGKFKEQPKLLEEGIDRNLNEMQIKRKNIAVLTEEEKIAFRQGEKRILDEYANKTLEDNKEKEDDISRFLV